MHYSLTRKHVAMKSLALRSLWFCWCESVEEEVGDVWGRCWRSVQVDVQGRLFHVSIWWSFAGIFLNFWNWSFQAANQMQAVDCFWTGKTVNEFDVQIWTGIRLQLGRMRRVSEGVSVDGSSVIRSWSEATLWGNLLHQPVIYLKASPCVCVAVVLQPLMLQNPFPPQSLTTVVFPSSAAERANRERERERKETEMCEKKT